MIMLGFSGTLVLLIGLWNARALMLSIRRMMVIFQRSRVGHFLMLLRNDRVRGTTRHQLTPSETVPVFGFAQ
jgi:hypothetical protein